MKFKHTINSESVRKFCIHNDLYTRGDNMDYTELLNSVDDIDDCTPQDIINIAKDIAKHSDVQDAKIDLSLGNITYYLCEDVIRTGFEFDD